MLPKGMYRHEMQAAGKRSHVQRAQNKTTGDNSRDTGGSREVVRRHEAHTWHHSFWEASATSVHSFELNCDLCSACSCCSSRKVKSQVQETIQELGEWRRQSPGAYRLRFLSNLTTVEIAWKSVITRSQKNESLRDNSAETRRLNHEWRRNFCQMSLPCV